MSPPATASPSKIYAWWLAARPATLTASFSPLILGSTLAFKDHSFHPSAAIAALLGALFIQIGTNFFNDYADFKRGADTDNRLGPARATQQGWLSGQAMLKGTMLAFMLATLCGSYLVWHAGWPVVVIGMISILSGLAYTGGPFPLAYIGMGDLFVMLFFGIVAVCGTYYVQALQWSQEALLLSVTMGAWATAILVVNNLRDRQSDAKVSKRTLAVRFGVTFCHWQFLLMLLLAYSIPFFTLPLHGAPWRLLYLLSLSLAAREYHGVRNKEGAALNVHLGGTAKTGLVYAMLLSGGIIIEAFTAP